jgi:MFS family permease
MVSVALAFAVLRLTDSVTALGQVLAARTGAMLLLLLLGGVVADRFPRTTVIQVCHALTAGTQGLAAYLIISGRATLTQIIVLEAANGAVSAFSHPAFIGVLPQLVDRARLQEANAVLAFSLSGLNVVGPALAGVLVATVGPGWALAADAFLYVVAIGCLVPIEIPAPEPGAAPNRSTLGDLRDGWTEFRARTWVWVVVLVFAVLNATHIGAMGVLGPVVARGTASLGDRGWGLVLAGEALGVLIGTVLTMRVRLRYPLRAGMVGVATMAPLIVAVGVVPVTALLVVLGVVAGIGVQVFEVGWTTSLQEHIPQERLSRVSSYDSFGSFVAMPIGTLAFGLLGSRFDPETLLVVSGLLFLAVSSIPLMVQSVRGLERASQPAETSADAG